LFAKTVGALERDVRCYLKSIKEFHTMHHKPSFFITVIATLIIAGCGGGGGTATTSTTPTSTLTSINGKAAIGAPMSYASISTTSLVDATSDTKTADVNGNFTIPAGTVTFPALVRAVGSDGSDVYYGYVSSASQTTVAINPLSTVELTLAAGKHPGLITHSINSSSLATAQSQVATIFAQPLTAASVSTSTDFLSTTSATDHTGLDMVLDSTSEYIEGDGTVVANNKLTSATTNFNSSTANSASPLTFDATSTTAFNNAPIATCSNFINGINSTNLSAADFDSTFLWNGNNATTFMSMFSGSTFKFGLPVFLGIDANSNYLFNLTVFNSTTNASITALNLPLKLNAGNCVFVGNQFPFEVTVQPAIKSEMRVDGTTTSPNVTTSPVAGFEVQLGGNSGSGGAVPANTWGGTQIASARVDVCDASSTCTVLATLTAPTSGVFTIDASSYTGTNYSFLNLIPNPGFPLINGVPDPIKISFFSTAPAPTTGGTTIGVLHTRVDGPAFTTSEQAAITMPSATNATTLLSASTTTNPTVNYDSGSAVVSSIGLTTDSTGSLVSKGNIVINSGIGSSAFSGFSLDSTTATYSSLVVDSHLPGRPGMVEVKYVWSPSCLSCK
jgi:hypothetical protein